MRNKAGGGPGPARNVRLGRMARPARPPFGLTGESYNHAGALSTQIWV
jgi:hypothetical protein